MKAYVYSASGPAIVEVPEPEPQGPQVKVRVRAGGLNRADLGIAKGHAHGATGGAGTVLGMEWAGEVVATGPEAHGVAIGDRVMGSGAAAFADYTLADHGRLFPVPDGMEFTQAASLPLALTTMHNALVTVGGVSAGQAVLIQGASSGVGLMGQQIARLKGAKPVIGSSTDPQRRARLTEFGASLAIDPHNDGWVGEVLAATGGHGVDLVIDQVSAATINQTLAATRIKGRIVNVGRLGGSRGVFDFDLHAARRIDYVGVTFRTRTISEIRDIFTAVRADIWPQVTSGALALPIDKVFAFADIADAYARMEANRHFGKIVIAL